MFFAQIARSMTFLKAYLLSGGSRRGPSLFLDQKNWGGPAPPLPQGLDNRPPASSLSEGLDRPLLLTFTADRQKAWWTFGFFFLFHPDACETTILIIYWGEKSSPKITRQIKKQFIADLKCKEKKNTTNNSSERLGFKSRQFGRDHIASGL